MTPRLRKLALTAHITFSVGWFGAVATFLALAIAGLTDRDAQLVRGAYAAMELTARFVIVPLAIASLLSGIVQSLGTPWGVFRHYWVLAKLLLTIFATVVLLAKMPLIGYAARRALEARSSSSADLHMVGIQLAVHAAGGLLVLLLITALSVFKPWGLTSYGLRQRQDRRDEPLRSTPALGIKAMSDPDSYTGRIGLSRGLKIYLATSAGAFVVVIHVSMYLAAHGFHHNN